MSSDKPDLARAGTMQVTAKEADALLGDSRPDPDAGTRGQQKKIEELSTPPPAKKAKKAASANSLKPATSIHKTLEEAKALYGDVDVSEGRSLRKRPEKPKPALKKAGTMQNTAKEGKAYLKRQKKGAAKKKKEEEKIEEEDANGEAEEEEASDE